MKFRIQFKVIFFILIFISIFFIPVTQAYCAEVDAVLLDVEKNMSNVNSVHASFVQKKQMAMFDMPVIIKGQFYIQNPDKFAWIVNEPIEYTLILTEDKIIKWDESNGTQELSLKENPMFKAMIDQITFWFSGAYASCEKDYDIRLISKEPSILEFTPKNHNPASKMLSNVTLVFQEDKKYISKIKLLEKNSDITELFFNDVQINLKIDKSVWEMN